MGFRLLSGSIAVIMGRGAFHPQCAPACTILEVSEQGNGEVSSLLSAIEWEQDLYEENTASLTPAVLFPEPLTLFLAPKSQSGSQFKLSHLPLQGLGLTT